MVALNFAFEDEADTFLQVAITTVANRNRRREGNFNLLREKEEYKFYTTRRSLDSFVCTRFETKIGEV